MDLAIMAGIGMIGSYIVNNNDTSEDNKIRLFPSDYNNNTRHVYDNVSVPQLNKRYYEMAEKQTEKSKNPVLTNILSPFYQPYENVTKDQLIMGSVPITELKTTENYENQFNLQKADNSNEPYSIGESNQTNLFDKNDFSPFDNKVNDMTYNITEKEDFNHNNMQMFTAKRDEETNESNNFEYKMDIFSGASKNWFPKREAPHFFEPQENVQNPFGSALVSDMERDRLVQSRIKQNQRPFEPIQTAKGLNLDYNEQPKTGFHDPFRTMPFDTNQLRPANKPKLTFEDRVKGGPKKGEKRAITAPVIKRRPLHWRVQGIDDLVPNKASTTKQTDTGNYIIPDNSRMRACELIGPSIGPTRSGPDNREGDVKINKRIVHVEDKLGPKTTERFNQNSKSYNILETERNTTNFNIMQPAKNTNQNGIKFDPNDISKPTKKQDLTNMQFNTNQKSNHQEIKTFDPNDISKPTKKQTLSNMQFNTQVSSNQKNSISNFTDTSKQTLKEILSVLELNNNIGHTQKNPIANLSDEAKLTFRQILTNIQTNTHISSNKKENIANLLDIAKQTTKELLTNLELNTNIQSANKNTQSNFQDNAKTTIRQTLTTAEFNTFLSRTLTDYANLTDEAKQTTKQILSTQPLETILNSVQKSSYSNIQDDVKQTIKQLLTLETVNNNVRQNIGSYSNITDEAKFTLKQLLAIIENNNNIKSSNQSTYTELTDLAKTTIREYITTIQLNNNMGTIKKEIAFDFNDLAKTTQKQDLLNEKYIGTMINSGTGITQTNYDIIPTMKDITKNIDYISGACSVGLNNQPMSQKAMRNMNQNISKEYISQGQYPTLSGPKLIPTKEQYDNMLQKNKPNFSRANPPTLTSKTDLNDRYYFNNENQRTYPGYDERLYNELLTQFDENPFINNPQSITNAKFKN
jgi:hypothetical protein